LEQNQKFVNIAKTEQFKFCASRDANVHGLLKPRV